MSREHVNLKAKTIMEISGACIDTIPIGTKFVITHINMEEYERDNKYEYGHSYSACSGLGITDIYNNEFELILD